VTLLPAPLATLPRALHRVGAWIRLDLLTRRVVGAAARGEPDAGDDEALDKLMVLRSWTARRLVN
jgi:hypothetical protein